MNFTGERGIQSCNGEIFISVSMVTNGRACGSDRGGLVGK